MPIIPAGQAQNEYDVVIVGSGAGGGQAAYTLTLAGFILLGGALGVSRVVTSLGWRPHHEQIGQTGSRISPDVYIPCGISGAIQHWAGCASSKTISGRRSRTPAASPASSTWPSPRTRTSVTGCRWDR